MPKRRHIAFAGAAWIVGANSRRRRDDDAGRYLVPDLPDVSYKVRVRGYGLRDSEPAAAAPGDTLDLPEARLAPLATSRKRLYRPRVGIGMRLSWPIGLALAVTGSELCAHHAIDNVYDDSREITIEGTVTEFRFTNPHPLLFVDVETDAGITQSWRLEMDNRFELERVGMSSETFEPGDRVVARGSAGRTRPRSVYLRHLERPADGLRYEQRGNTPHLALGTR